jgi:hypothetical protein
VNTSTSEVTVKVTADTTDLTRELRRVRRDAERTMEALRVPRWCYRPYLRAFVMANALAFPISLIAHVVAQ